MVEPITVTIPEGVTAEDIASVITSRIVAALKAQREPNRHDRLRALIDRGIYDPDMLRAAWGDD